MDDDLLKSAICGLVTRLLDYHTFDLVSMRICATRNPKPHSERHAPCELHTPTLVPSIPSQAAHLLPSLSSAHLSVCDSLAGRIPAVDAYEAMLTQGTARVAELPSRGIFLSHVLRNLFAFA